MKELEACCGAMVRVRWIDKAKVAFEGAVVKGGSSIDVHGRRWVGWAGLRSWGWVVYLLPVFDVQYVKCIDLASPMTSDGNIRRITNSAIIYFRNLLLYFLLPIYTTNTRCSKEKNKIQDHGP
jgi:hypothetical protein